MSPESIIALVGGGIVAITLLTVTVKKFPKRVKPVQYIRKWREIQKLCKNKEDWTHAIIHADMLLDEVLVKKRISGKTMGERMVAANGKFTANDKVWEAHKLANSLRQDGDRNMKEVEVKDALITYRQSLRDLKVL